MEHSTPNTEHHMHHAHHSLEDGRRQSSDRKSISFSSPLAQPTLSSPPPTQLKEDDRKDPEEPKPQEEGPSLPLKTLRSWHRSGRTDVFAYPEPARVENKNSDEVRIGDKTRESGLL
ncbi:hypothetical protein F52700_8438 [Fusarium sp. NRRL 52700]|nr:hypothetical protein F52700_8438 [Fusarium sp. NRRL 52700]